MRQPGFRSEIIISISKRLPDLYFTIIIPSMKRTSRKNVFLSHGLAENGLAQELAEALSHLGVHVSEPSTRVLEGNNFATSIASALKNSDGMVVIITPNSVKSPMLQNEIAYALKRPRFKHKLVPVIRGNIQSYPWILRQMNPIHLGRDVALMASEVARRLGVSRTRPRLSPKGVMSKSVSWK